MNNKTFAYGRISGANQNEERQLTVFRELNIDERDIFIDKQSGKDFKREQYQVLKNALREGDLLIIKSIDRLGRNYDMILEEWKDITKNIKANIRVLDMPLLDTSNNDNGLIGAVINDIVLQLLSYVAEQERTFIRQRQREGIDVMPVVDGKRISTKTNRAMGRPKVEKPDNYEEVVSRWEKKEITAIQAMKELNLKPNTFYNMVYPPKTST